MRSSVGDHDQLSPGMRESSNRCECGWGKSVKNLRRGRLEFYIVCEHIGS